MEQATQCRKFAEECRRYAAGAETEEERKVLVEMAAVWTKKARKHGKRDFQTLGWRGEPTALSMDCRNVRLRNTACLFGFVYSDLLFPTKEISKWTNATSNCWTSN